MKKSSLLCLLWAGFSLFATPVFAEPSTPTASPEQEKAQEKAQEKVLDRAAKTEILRMYKNFLRAVKSNDVEGYFRHYTQGSLAHFERELELAKYGTKAEILKLDRFTASHVIRLRCRMTAEEMAGLENAQAMAKLLIDRNPPSEPYFVNRFNLRLHENRTVASIPSFNDYRQRLHLFRVENGSWKFDLERILKDFITHNPAAPADAQEIDFEVRLMVPEDQPYHRCPPDLWTPPLTRPVAKPDAEA